jgi:formylglycine-generating enzyme required for sulfatase activity
LDRRMGASVCDVGRVSTRVDIGRYGLYNMIGNAWEWVDDWWNIRHPPASNRVYDNPTGAPPQLAILERDSLCHGYRPLEGLIKRD